MTEHISDLYILIFVLAFLVGCLTVGGFILIAAMRQAKVEANALLKHIESVKRQCLREAENAVQLTRDNLAETQASFRAVLDSLDLQGGEIKSLRSRVEEINNRVAVHSIKR